MEVAKPTWGAMSLSQTTIAGTAHTSRRRLGQALARPNIHGRTQPCWVAPKGLIQPTSIFSLLEPAPRRVRKDLRRVAGRCGTGISAAARAAVTARNFARLPTLVRLRLAPVEDDGLCLCWLVFDRATTWTFGHLHVAAAVKKVVESGFIDSRAEETGQSGISVAHASRNSRRSRERGDNGDGSI